MKSHKIKWEYKFSLFMVRRVTCEVTNSNLALAYQIPQDTYPSNRYMLLAYLKDFNQKSGEVELVVCGLCGNCNHKIDRVGCEGPWFGPAVPDLIQNPQTYQNSG